MVAQETDTLIEPSQPPEAQGPFRQAFLAIRRRIIAGLIVALPIVLTFWIVYWLYATFKQLLLDPTAQLINYLVATGRVGPLPDWWKQTSPLLSIVLVLLVLYFLGLFFRSRLHRAVDWVLLHLPVVMTIYSAMRNVFISLDAQREPGRFKRVVLVAFPHPGMRVPAFVTQTIRDRDTGRNILCIYVPTTPVPTSGYMILVPEEEVTELDWSINDTLQAIISGGISSPPDVRYHRGRKISELSSGSQKPDALEEL